jgi:hypothetical protein
MPPRHHRRDTHQLPAPATPSSAPPYVPTPPLLRAPPGSYFTLSLFDKMWHPDLTEDEAVAMMEAGVAEVRAERGEGPDRKRQRCRTVWAHGAGAAQQEAEGRLPSQGALPPLPSARPIRPLASLARAGPQAPCGGAAQVHHQGGALNVDVDWDVVHSWLRNE